MKEHSLIMSSPLIPALLDGRKTQTRRVVAWSNSLVDGTISKWWREHWLGLDFDKAWVDSGPSPAGNPGPYLHVSYPPEYITHRIYPRIQTGDLIWVKETHFQTIDNEGHDKPGISYLEDEPNLFPGHWRKVSSLFMPRRAARIIRRVVDVRAEHLQDISVEDAIAEGVCAYPPDGHGMKSEVQRWFQEIWDSLGGNRHSWKENPFCWVYDLKKEIV